MNESEQVILIKEFASRVNNSLQTHEIIPEFIKLISRLLGHLSLEKRK